jgi:glyoxylase-like metal-dependent hydrolase (beta-lactamase superfamily II)
MPMADEVEFPFSDYPEPGSATEVADGVFWISTPVPFVGLKQVNAWLLRDGPGWTMIDCGYGVAAVREQLRQVWSRVLCGLPITRLLVTHFHPDHAGNSGFISDYWQVRPWMSQGEWYAANAAKHDQETDATAARGVFYQRHGLAEPELVKFIDEVIPYKDGVELPSSYLRLRNGREISIGGDHWRVLIGEGHSPEHVSLYCDRRRILIAGDQILPAITTNVSTWQSEPEFDAVGAFLATSKMFRGVLAADTLVLPSHRKPFTNVRRRLNELALHHAQRLSLMLSHAEEEVSAGELISVLFRSGLDGHQIGFAMGEAIAHLNHLVELGHLRVVETKDRVFYRRTTTGNVRISPHFQ